MLAKIRSWLSRQFAFLTEDWQADFGDDDDGLVEGESVDEFINRAIDEARDFALRMALDKSEFERFFYARLNDLLRPLPLANDYGKSLAVASAANAVVREVTG